MKNKYLLIPVVLLAGLFMGAVGDQRTSVMIDTTTGVIQNKQTLTHSNAFRVVGAPSVSNDVLRWQDTVGTASNANLLQGFTAKDLTAISATYYLTTNLITYGAVTGRSASLSIPTAIQTATYTGPVSNNQYLATYLISSNEMPNVLSQGVYTFTFKGGQIGPATKDVAIAGELYILNSSDASTVQEFTSTVAYVPKNTNSYFTIDVLVTNQVPKDAYAFVLKTKIINVDGYTGDFLSQFGASALARFTMPSASGVYVSQAEFVNVLTNGSIGARLSGLTNTLGFFLGGNGTIGTNGSASILTINASPVVSGSMTVSNVALTYPQWVDTAVSYAYSATGPSAPTLVSVSGGSPIQLLGFNNTTVLYGLAQWPHNIATTNATTPVLYYEPHVHFSVVNAPAPGATNVTWRLIWQYGEIGIPYGTRCFTNTVTMSITTSNVQYLAEFGHFTNNNMGITGIFRCRLDRPASAVGDYDSAATVLLNGFDIHVPIANFTISGSRQDAVQ